MAVIKEFCCVEHGDFEGSHPICPGMGCCSDEVTRVFRTAPSISKGKFKRFDASTRRSADMMGISNFRSTREGEVSFAGRASQESKDLGMEVLWGNDVEKKMGKSFAGLTSLAQQPLNVKTKSGDKVLTRNNAMAEMATEAGLTSRAVPKAGEVIGLRTDRNEAKARALL